MALDGSSAPSGLADATSKEVSAPLKVDEDSMRANHVDADEPKHSRVPATITEISLSGSLDVSKPLVTDMNSKSPSPPANGITDIPQSADHEQRKEKAEETSDVDPSQAAEPSSNPMPPPALPASTLTTDAVQPEVADATSAADTVAESSARVESDGCAPTTVKVAREREEDEAEDAPSSKRTKIEDASQEEAPMVSVSQTSESGAASQPVQPSSTDSQAILEMQSPPDRDEWGNLTEAQSKRLLEGMRNLKKGKHASHFSKPVDAVALNLPTYTTIVKEPMDLSTMEQKLKDNQYSSVADYIADFNLMVMNAINFNGQQHAVAQAGMMLRSQLNAQLRKVPKINDPLPPEANQKAKRSSLPGPTREAPKRESRPSFGTNPSPITPFAPDPNGVPLARRDSSAIDRPKRKIQRPAPRDLTYPKTQKKKYKAELKFAEEVLTEMERPRYQSFSAAFLQPVDPVALNIPNYHQVIKKPMDVSTIRQKLTEQQYENLKEFESDFRLMFKNCYRFNPPGHPVDAAGHQFEEIFNQEMAKKNERIKALAPPSTRESSQEESEEEEEEEDEEDEETEQQKKLRQLNEQLAALSEQAAKLMQDGAGGKKTKGKKKNAKVSKPESKKKKTSGAGAAAPRPEKKSKPKPTKSKTKPLTQKEKEEISNRIFELPTEEINTVAEQIKKSMRERGIAVTDETEMEFNIDDIPDEILRNILARLRRNQAGAMKNEDDGDDSPAQNYAPKGKRNKPMSRVDTENRMAAIQQQINSFSADNGEYHLPSDRKLIRWAKLTVE